MENKKQSGFTLIELLVVIAIIGILASVVLASLNSARNKGSDAAIKANMANARAQAELFYDNAGNVYTAVCTAAGGISTLIQQASTTSGTGAIVTSGALQTSTTANCFSTALAWAASVPLKSPATTTYYCVDSTGVSRETTNPLALNAVVCN